MDMVVDLDTLCVMERNLEQINYGLINSVSQMDGAVKRSRDFLSGKQFEKAQKTTDMCLKLTRDTMENINCAKNYVKQLEVLVDEYSKCGYRWEES